MNTKSCSKLSFVCKHFKTTADEWCFQYQSFSLKNSLKLGKLCHELDFTIPLERGYWRAFKNSTKNKNKKWKKR